MSTAPFVPADLLLDPSHMPLFLTWQGSHIDPDYKGMIRNAIEYHEFLQFLNEAAETTNQATNETLATTLRAALCGHELHPSAYFAPHYCPTCEVVMALKFLDAIANALQKAGGPWHQRDYNRYNMCTLRQGWHMARLQLQVLVESLEVSAENERHWEHSNPDFTTATIKMNTAAKAVRLALMEHKYPAKMSESQQIGNKRKAAHVDESLHPQVKKKKKKTVTFATDTKFEPGRDSALYARNSRDYEPGNHACEEGDSWLNTSQCGLHSVDFSNLKLFVTRSREDFDSMDDSVSNRTGEYQGLVGQHLAFGNTSDFVAEDTKVLGMDMETLKRLVLRCDAITVLIDEDDMLLDYDMSRSPDIEDLADEEVTVDQKRWTCLRDIKRVQRAENLNTNLAEGREISRHSRKIRYRESRKASAT